MKSILFKNKLFVFGIVFICNSCITAHSQNSDFRFENITSRDGLADRTVNTIIQDAKGFIWIGSGEGLTRYDGYSCVVYRHISGNPESLSDNQVYALCIDGEGALWIGTRNGLNRYDAQNDRFEKFYYNSSDDNSLSGNQIFALAKDSAGNLWAGTYGGGLDVMLKTRKKSATKIEGYRFIHYKHNDRDSSTLSSNRILSLCFDKQNQLWVGTAEGLNILQTGTKKFTRFYHQPAGKNSITNNTVNKIFSDKNGTVWICARGMLDNIAWQENISKDNITVQHFLPKVIGNKKLNDWVINDFITDSRGTAWMASKDQGLAKFNITKQGEINSLEQFESNWQIPYSLANSSVNCLSEDRCGVVWIGTETGVSKYIPSKARFNEVNFFDKSFAANKFYVWALLSDKQNRLWLADADTLYVINKKGNYSSSIQIIPLPVSHTGIDEVNVLHQSTAGDVYIGTMLQGLFIIPKSLANIYDKKNWLQITVNQYPALPSNNIYSITEDAKGMIWIGTYKGLCRYNAAKRQMQRVYASPDGTVVPDYIIRSLCVDDKDIVWCGTDNGVYCIKGGNVIRSFKNMEKDAASLSHNGIIVCYTDHNKNIWIGTKEGLNLYDPLHNNFQRFSAQNGLSNDRIRSLQEDAKGNLWIATNHGLIRHNIYNKKTDTYSLEDGLTSDQFVRNAVCTDTTGIFYFGTNNGLVTFKPQNILPNKYVPPVVITNINILNKPLFSLGDTTLINTYRKENKLLLQYHQNFFSFEFAALNYINSAANQYAYTLEGVDRQWNNSGTKRFAGYTDIAPGHYVFKVKASNNDGIWNNVPATVDVIIIPPWWQTWWFYTLCFITVCTIGYLIYRIRLQQILKVYKLRTNIARDLHDDVGSALSSIALLSNIAQDRKTNARLKPEEIFSRIGDTSKHMIDLMDDIVWSVNPANDKFSNMLIRMREYAAEMLEAKNISFSFTMSEDIDDLKIPMHMRKHYFLIFKEAVNNLAKYSACYNAAITIIHTNRTLITTITDNGKGFDAHIIYSGNGLKNMQERAIALKGKINIEAKPNQGTCVTLIIPVT